MVTSNPYLNPLVKTWFLLNKTVLIGKGKIFGINIEQN